MPETEAELDGIRREQLRLLTTIETMRRVQAMSPDQPPGSMSEAELARRLVYDLITTLTRNEVVLLTATEAIVEQTEVQRRVADMREAELNMQRRELRLNEQKRENEVARDQRYWSALSRAGNAFGAWAWNIISHERTVSAIVGGIVVLIGMLTAAATSGSLGEKGCGP